MPVKTIKELTAAAADNGIILTGGYGPKHEENIASPDQKIVNNAFEFWKQTFDVLSKLNITQVGGGLYSYWPVNFDQPFNKDDDLKRSIAGMKKLGALAAEFNITLGMEVLNRFEGYLLNTAEEAVSYVKAVGRDNVKVMLDSFHMNIEEDSIIGAIKTAGSYLGFLHIGEANRLPPHEGSRMDWPGMGRALNEIGYTGTVVMEPFVIQGGQVGKDIKIWRNLAPEGEAELDEAARKSVEFIRKCFNPAGMK
jgi:D-psicose/D-tagatose/L-ribulose 3-epimerase